MARYYNFNLSFSPWLYTLHYKHSSISQIASESWLQESFNDGKYNQAKLKIYIHIFKFLVQNSCIKVRSELKPLKVERVVIYEIQFRSFSSVIVVELPSKTTRRKEYVLDHFIAANFHGCFSIVQHCDWNEYVCILRLKYKMIEIILAVC